jgi:hypothetical protein
VLAYAEDATDTHEPSRLLTTQIDESCNSRRAAHHAAGHVKGCDCDMGMELRRDWDADVQLDAETGAAPTVPHVVPTRTSRPAKLLVLAAASGVTFIWIAFVSVLVARFFGLLF